MKSSIKSIKIPSSVTNIEKFAFTQSTLRYITFTKDSKLQTIEKESFQFTSIERILIPPQVKTIGARSFYNCKQLQIVETINDSKLQIIENMAFAFTSIRSLTIPSQVNIIGEKAFCNCMKLQIIEFNEKSKINYIDSKWFDKTKNVIVMISKNL